MRFYIKDEDVVETLIGLNNKIRGLMEAVVSEQNSHDFCGRVMVPVKDGEKWFIYIEDEPRDLLFKKFNIFPPLKKWDPVKEKREILFRNFGNNEIKAKWVDWVYSKYIDDNWICRK